MANMEEVELAVNTVRSQGLDDIAMLQCTEWHCTYLCWPFIGASLTKILRENDMLFSNHRGMVTLLDQQIM